MNTKVCKAIRRMVRQATKPGTPAALLLAKPVKVQRLVKGEVKTFEAIVAVNAADSFRGRYHYIKDLYASGHPDIVERVEQFMADEKLTRKFMEMERERAKVVGPGSATYEEMQRERYTGLGYGPLTKDLIKDGPA